MPLLWLSLAFLLGILIGERSNALPGWPVSAWLFLSGVVLAGLLLRPLRRLLPFQALALSLPIHIPALPLPVPVLLLALTLGATRFELSQPKITPAHIAWYRDLELTLIVEGVIIAPPDERDLSTFLRVQVDQLRPLDNLLFTPVQGLLLAKVPPRGDWRFGDRVRLQGQIQTPPIEEAFSYRDYLARQGIFCYMPKASADILLHDQGNKPLALVYGLKHRAQEILYQSFPDPEASLLSGILLGVDEGIPDQVQKAFTATGTSHIIAISGFNMSIIAGLFAATFGRLLGKRRGAVAAGAGIALYTLLVGAEAAVVRAAIMGGLSLFARQFGRRQDGLNSLAFVAAVMALFNPQILWDWGFQLSFTATLGLVLYADPFSQAFIRFITRPRSFFNGLPLAAARRLAGPVGEYFLFTLAAQVTTLPVMAYHFRQLSLISLVVNPLVLPAQPAVMIVGGLAVICGVAWAPLGWLASWLAWPFVAYTIRVVELFAPVRGGVVHLGAVALPAVILFYGLLLGWTFGGFTWMRTRLQKWLPGGVLPHPAATLSLSALGVITAVVWRMALSAPDGRLHLTVLQVGGGEGLLVQTPAGRNLLIDGGLKASVLSDGLGRRLPPLRRELEWLVVAGVGDEQIQALPSTLERFPPAQVLWSGPPAGSDSARELWRALTEAQIPVIEAQAGQSLELGSGAVLRVLAVTRRGAVLLLERHSFQALLPIGLDFESLEALQDEDGLQEVDALLLADSGYAPANPPEWIAKLHPGVVLLSVEAGNWQGLPDPETLEAVAGYTLLRTDRNGWIEVSTDGERMWVEVERR